MKRESWASNYRVDGFSRSLDGKKGTVVQYLAHPYSSMSKFIVPVDLLDVVEVVAMETAAKHYNETGENALLEVHGNRISVGNNHSDLITEITDALTETGFQVEPVKDDSVHVSLAHWFRG